MTLIVGSAQEIVQLQPSPPPPQELVPANEGGHYPPLYLVPEQPEVPENPSSPLVIEIAKTKSDTLTRHRAERFAAQVAMQYQVEQVVDAVEASPISSLKDAAHRAAKGDPMALKVVEANFRKDGVERTTKVEHVMNSELEVDDDGVIHQHGQTQEAFQANSIVFASNHEQMAQRITAENNNAFRIKQALMSGDLEDHYFVVISRAADDMDTEDMAEEGFFVDTMSTSIQATSLREDGNLNLASAFVAGIAEPGVLRHDQQTVVKMGNKLNIDFAGMNSTETIDFPFLVHKSLMPNGVIDLVQLWDDCAGGTWFGQNKPRQDYVESLGRFEQREQEFEPRVQAAVSEFLADVSSIKTETDATKLLAKMSEKHMLEQAINDPSIDPMVFGEKAAPHILEARYHSARGDIERVEASKVVALEEAKSYSCPGGAKTSSKSADSAAKSLAGSSAESLKNAWTGGKIFKNAECRSCHKIKHEVGACRICEDCVNNPKNSKYSSKEEEDQKSKASTPKVVSIMDKIKQAEQADKERDKEREEQKQKEQKLGQLALAA